MRALSALVAILLFVSKSEACSFARSEIFTEVSRDLSVSVLFEEKPFVATKVALIRDIPSIEQKAPVAPTTIDADGTAQFRNLPPGKYFLEVSHLGISVAFEQIEVKARATAEAKTRMEYRWSAAPTLVRRASGTLIDTQRPGGLSWLERVLSKFQRQFPISGARIRLQHPTSGHTYDLKTDEDGKFEFAGVQVGTYVLQVWREKSSPNPESFVIRVTSQPAKDSLQFAMIDFCGGRSLRLLP